MRVAAVIDQLITAGGGFSQSVSAAHQLLRLVGGKHEARVYTTIAANVEPLRELGISAIALPFGAKDRLLGHAARHAVLRAIQSKLKMIGRLEQALLQDGIDLVYFVGPTRKSLALQTLPMISTVWDVCHLDMPEFPEVRNFNGIADREEYLSAALPQSIAVLVDSPELAETVTRRYALDRRRVIAMPFSPSAYLEETDPGADHEQPGSAPEVPIAGDYLFYPAQFWPHKNHVRIIEALRLLRDRGVEQKVVFCGHDHGNVAHLKRTVSAFGVEDLVTLLGFVTAAQLRQLYLRCRAIVFASYFGPTNLPPLEAWKLKRPLVCAANLEGHVGSAAALFDADSAESLAEAIIQVRDEQVARDLVERGTQRLRVIDSERVAAERQLQACLDRFELKVRCWKSPEPAHAARAARS